MHPWAAEASGGPQKAGVHPWAAEAGGGRQEAGVHPWAAEASGGPQEARVHPWAAEAGVVCGHGSPVDEGAGRGNLSTELPGKGRTGLTDF